jgi:hypothetical protein
MVQAVGSSGFKVVGEALQAKRLIRAGHSKKLTDRKYIYIHFDYTS